VRPTPPTPQELIKITEAALVRIINQYCGYEAGVRNLRKCLDRIFRKIVAKMEDKKLLDGAPTTTIDVTSESSASAEIGIALVKEYQVNTGNLERFLDVPPTDDHYYQGINQKLPVGSSNGLAYVDDGMGSVLKIQFVRKEFSKQPPEAKKTEEEGGATPARGSNGAQLTHTGRLGEVMKESVEVVKIAVFNFLVQQQLAPDFDKNSYHLHVPMGAIPKDGPSAGISLFAALTSIAVNKPVVESIAMTGEITTLGEVIAIGGVREKLTACKNHQINKVILPLSNKKNVTKLPDEFKRGFTIFYVKDIS
jgi:ATP-dependent Lon protease